MCRKTIGYSAAAATLQDLLRITRCCGLLDRILHRSHRIHLDAKESIRKAEAEEEFAKARTKNRRSGASAAKAADGAGSCISQIRPKSIRPDNLCQFENID
jgi:hypothetical protein